MRFRPPGGDVVWRDGRVEPGAEHAETDDHGRFTFDQLPEGPLVVSMTDTGGEGSVARKPTRLLPTVYEDIEQDVAAEAEHVTIDLPAAWVEVSVTLAEGANSYPEVFVTERAHDTVDDDTPAASVHAGHPHDGDYETGDERIVVGVAPDREIVVSAAAEGMLGTLRKVRPLAPGARETVPLRLAPDPSLATAVVVVEAAGGEAIEAFSVKLTRADDEEIHELTYMPGARAQLRVSPGTYRVVAAGPTAGTTDTHWLLPATTEMTLRAGETTTARLTLPRGGHLRLAARAPDGRYIPATCRLVDAGGVTHARRWKHAGPRSFMLNDRRLGGAAASTTTEPLPPGTWTIELGAAGFADARATVEIEPGKTATLEVAMPSP